jgi:hypothetical protein
MRRCEPVDPDDAAAAPREGGKRGAADDAETDDRYVVDGHALTRRAAQRRVPPRERVPVVLWSDRALPAGRSRTPGWCGASRQAV